jgi:pimeloyl-[acyl-carrier protein] synthase
MQRKAADPALSLYHLLDPAVLANPYPLYARLRREDPVHWDPFLHKWVLTRYADVVFALQRFSARCAPTPEQLDLMGMGVLSPAAQVMVRQMLFMDPPDHTRIRSLAAKAFTPRRVEVLRQHIEEIVDGMLDAVAAKGRMDVIADLAAPLPATVTGELLGVPRSDRDQLKAWSEDFAELLGNFQLNPDRVPRLLRSIEALLSYFHEAVRRDREQPGDGLIHALVTAEIDGDRLSDDEIVANTIVTMVGGQETTTNLIATGLLTLFRHPDQLARLRADLSLVAPAVEELLRYEAPSQQTTRIAPEDVELGGKLIHQGESCLVVMGAANRDPDRFPDPDRLDLTRPDNRHVAFGWAGHFCFGAPLGRIEGQTALRKIFQRFPDIELEPGAITWRNNLGLRGLTALPVKL